MTDRLTRLHCDLPCSDVNRDFTVPQVALDPDGIRLVTISEAPVADRRQYFCADSAGSFFRNTRGRVRRRRHHRLELRGHHRSRRVSDNRNQMQQARLPVTTDALKTCSRILERELSQLPNLKVIMSMGGFDIRDPPGMFELNGIRCFPSYTQTAPGFDIDKSKRAMIAEDIARAMACLSPIGERDSSRAKST